MKLFILLLLIILFTPLTILADKPFDKGYAGFTVKVKDISNPYNVFAIYILPEESVSLSFEEDLQINSDEGVLNQQKDNKWLWKAPKISGLYPVILENTTGQKMTLNMLVMRPASSVKSEKLDGYRIGSYSTTLFKGLSTYKAPKGFVEVTNDNRNTLISPHFTLGQFLCKQSSRGDKKFVVLRPEMLLKLEYILQEVNKQGHDADSFFIMSGYRTPFYNKSIGSSQFSRHIYGGASDIFVDSNPKDGYMDDLNKDGKIDRKDAAVLYNLIEKLSKDKGWNHTGGLGEYGVSHNHGPFVHVDARGYRARWGKK